MKRAMRRVFWMMVLALGLVLSLSLGLAACGGRETAAGGSRIEPTENSFVLRVTCESQGVRQIGYLYFAGEESRGGGWIDPEKDLGADEELSLSLNFDKEGKEREVDLSGFAIEFTLSDKDGAELGTTERLAIPAACGEAYEIRITGDRDRGFAAELRESEGEG